MGENDPEEKLRMILIGNTGSGKSASGNIILGRQHFLSEFSGSSVTKVCQLATSDYPVEVEAGRRSRRKKVVVLDLPGFGDTHLPTRQIIMEISRCVSLTTPGPHAFLLVLPLGRYTEEVRKAVTMMAAVFGEAAVSNHTVVLFTMGDRLKEPMEKYLAKAPPSLKALIDRCGGRYHILNNEDQSNVQQVHELLGKVEQVVEDNGGGCYTNAMYREEEAAIREKENRVRREEEDRVRGEEEDRVRREEEDRVRREEDRVRREEEDKVRKEEDRVKREKEDEEKREEDRIKWEEEDRVRKEEDRVRREEDRVRREKDRVRREKEDRVRREKDRVRREEEDRVRREEDRVRREKDRVSGEEEERVRREEWQKWDEGKRVRRQDEDRVRKEDRLRWEAERSRGEPCSLQ